MDALDTHTVCLSKFGLFNGVLYLLVCVYVCACVFIAAIELQPSDALLYKLRADVRGHLGLTQQALQDYGTALELQEAQESGASPC